MERKAESRAKRNAGLEVWGEEYGVQRVLETQEVHRQEGLSMSEAGL